MASFDYIVIGSGAGGGTVAARLAENGMRVLVLEAGGDPRKLRGGVRGMGAANRLPDDYDVPAFHPFATENEALRWDFFTHHYADPARQARDPKADDRGVLYPRAGTLGGCTAHNAMIFVYPHEDDWQAVADLTGDASWAPARMHGYLERLEDCRYRPIHERLERFGIDRTGHGFDGWLSTEKAIPRGAMRDDHIRKLIKQSLHGIIAESADDRRRFWDFLESSGDPNDIDVIQRDAEGLRFTPMTTRNHRRVGTRERLLDVAERYPGRLVIELDALATRIFFDDDNRAIGVEYRKGERLYQAHANPSRATGEARHARAAREVIVAGGAFNTPQLLMLSGIGPADELARLDIESRVALDGVGRNLQDRYEVTVVYRMAFDSWESMDKASFSAGDPLWQAWQRGRDSMYNTNGASLGLICRSAADKPLPDLFLMALLAKFDGYYPGYAAELAKSRQHLSWAVLKAHTNNRAGRVRLASRDPRTPPRIDFHYFDEGSAGAEDDLQAVVEGVKLVRRLSEPLREQGLIAGEELPGDHVRSDDEIADFVRDHAWGHHASCSCAIGPQAQGGVLDSRFRVYGTHGLRVVDACVFPRIPGFFIAAAVYLAAEKAADVILEDARDRAA
ncbi:MAG: GMC family oxidoreductase [Geminicoccaceae bacterium]